MQHYVSPKIFAILRKEGVGEVALVCVAVCPPAMPCPLLLLLSSLGSEKEEMLPCSATLAARYSAVSALLWVGGCDLLKIQFF